MAEQKKNRGRPSKYSDVEAMQKKIDEYFEEHAEKPTVCGLALALDLTRQGLIEYSGKPEFSDTIKKAKLRIEARLEEKLENPAVAGIIFNLKNNFGWKDSQEVVVHDSDKMKKMEQRFAEIMAEKAKK